MSPIQTFYTVPAGSPVKSVQRGSAAGAGTVTITAVDINKSFVNVFGSASSGTVSASFNMSAAASGNVAIPGMGPYNGNAPGNSSIQNGVQGLSVNSQYWLDTRAVNAANYNIGAGTNNLVSAVVQGYLSNSTSLVVSGACRWEVVEFN